MTQADAALEDKPARSSGVYAKAVRRFMRNRMAVAGLVFLVIVILAAVFAPWVAPYKPDEIFWSSIRQPPSAQFLLGTDEIGRDILSRLIYGSQYSLFIGVFVTTLSLTSGILIGLIAGYYRGWIDTAIMRLMDIILAFPSLLQHSCWSRSWGRACSTR